jgi:hypothetical protein
VAERLLPGGLADDAEGLQLADSDSSIRRRQGLQSVKAVGQSASANDN